MKKHNGMRPLDVYVLLKLSLYKGSVWQLKDIAASLQISASEVSESLNRSAIAGLISADKKKLMREALLEFLTHGLRYVFPQKPGPLARGIPTAHSAPPLNELINSDELYVWPYAEGNVRGQSIEPLYKTVPGVSLRDNALYQLLALTDALRTGKTREQKLAAEELKRRILNYEE
jgi:hypothetical protein